MGIKNISITFCGGCNPRIDRGGLAKKVSELMVTQGCTVVFNRPDADFIIYISGCSANCAWRYSKAQAAHIIVAGAAVDSIAAAETELVSKIMHRVRDYLERLENGVSK
ncbi:hypothetical protein [Anaerospora hongkongensis]|uniref:hypothetical protein n=1 Tax=Anaerospora hongkongensis TaxID=244830 RepID=UPI00289D4AEF|nr:hypothetical protein [Anaerospora hongkongensis]